LYEAIRALEQVDVLSWVNRIKRVRENVPRPVRQPGATALRGAGSPAALSVGIAPAEPIVIRSKNIPLLLNPVTLPV
jgi:hypothetical protein